MDEEEKMSARARKIYLMKELFGDDSVLDEVGRDISARSLSPTVYTLYRNTTLILSIPPQSYKFLVPPFSPLPCSLLVGQVSKG